MRGTLESGRQAPHGRDVPNVRTAAAADHPQPRQPVTQLRHGGRQRHRVAVVELVGLVETGAGASGSSAAARRG
jgi:hypothetical protein